MDRYLQTAGMDPAVTAWYVNRRRVAMTCLKDRLVTGSVCYSSNGAWVRRDWCAFRVLTKVGDEKE
eukprot:2871957-Rhodomonas_salina.2